MRVFLIDAENINLKLFSELTRFGKKDKFYFIGNENLKIGYKIPKFIAKKRCKFFSFNGSSKDYADKIILTLMGYLCSKKKIKKIYIISNDRIFSNLDYVYKMFGKKIKILKFLNVEYQENKQESIQQGEKTDNSKATNVKQLMLKNSKEASLKEFVSQNLQKIKNIKELALGKADFHNKLTQEFGQKGRDLYKYIKENNKEILDGL